MVSCLLKNQKYLQRLLHLPHYRLAIEERWWIEEDDDFEAEDNPWDKYAITGKTMRRLLADDDFDIHRTNVIDW